MEAANLVLSIFNTVILLGYAALLIWSGHEEEPVESKDVAKGENWISKQPKTSTKNSSKTYKVKATNNIKAKKRS